MAGASSPSCRCSALALAGLLLAAATQAQEVLHLNPFNDPFIQATAGRACPAPLGPAYTDAEIRQQEHYRVERGTSCWLAGTCSEPNAFRFDPRLAREAVAALRADATLADSAIWVVVEHRSISLLGCAASAAQAARAEALMHAIADVQLVFPLLAVPGEAPRYPLADGRP